MIQKVGVVAFLAMAVGSPNHDVLQINASTHSAFQHYFSSGAASNGRSLQASETCEQISAKSWEPIRVGYEIVDMIPKYVQSYIDTVMTKTIAYLEATVQVHRSTGPLRANRRCTATWTDPASTCAASDKATTCGVDQIPIPEKYLNSLKTCTIQPDEGCTSQPAGDGVVGKDFLALVTVRDTNACSGDTQAYAGWCVKDQCDRPVFAGVNFCLSKVSAAQTDDMVLWVSTALHELVHSLVFSSNLYKYFRNPDGSPKMARDASDPEKLQDAISWRCQAGYVPQFPATSGNLLWADISSVGIVAVANERGFDTCQCPLGKTTMGDGCVVATGGDRTPTCVIKSSTPKVVEMVRDHFDCDTLTGAEFENQDTSDCVIVGSHWEQRIFNSELMASTANVGPLFVSKVTLALFEDSGWYKVDYNMADDLVKGVHWGYKQGCAFATEKCVTNGVTKFPRTFCTSPSQDACAADRSGTLKCSLVTYTTPPVAQFAYISGGAVGSIPEADFCPFYKIKISNHVCANTGSMTIPFSNINMRREVFGASSKCLESNLRGDVTDSEGTYKANDASLEIVRSSCFDVSCSSDKASYTVKVADLANGGTRSLGTCTAADQKLTDTTGSLQGEVVCANPPEVCQFGPAKSFSGGPFTSSSPSPAAPSPTPAATPAPTTSTTVPATTTTMITSITTTTAAQIQTTKKTTTPAPRKKKDSWIPPWTGGAGCNREQGRMCLNIDESQPYCVNGMDLQEKSSYCSDKGKLSPSTCKDMGMLEGSEKHGTCDYTCNACASKDMYPTYSEHTGDKCTYEQLFKTGDTPPMTMASYLCSKGGLGWTGEGLQTCMWGATYFFQSAVASREACYKKCENVCDQADITNCYINSPAICEEGCDFARFGIPLCSDCTVDPDASLCAVAVGTKYVNSDFNFLTMTGCALRSKMGTQDCINRCQQLTFVSKEVCSEGCEKYVSKYGNCPGVTSSSPTTIITTSTTSTIITTTTQTTQEGSPPTTTPTAQKTTTTTTTKLIRQTLIGRQSMGAAGCQCIGSLPSVIADVDCTYDWAFEGKCIETKGVSLPASYGEKCGEHAEPGDADCYVCAGGGKKSRDFMDCYTAGDAPVPRDDPEFWCGQKWCYVDPCHCDMSDATKSTYFDVALAYSYATCGGSNGYTDKKFPDQNLVGNANKERYDGDCSAAPTTPSAPETVPSKPKPSKVYKVRYDVRFTADVSKTGDELMADASFIGGLIDAIFKGWGAAGSTVARASILIISITLTDPGRRLMGKLEPRVPTRARAQNFTVLNNSDLATPNVNLVAELKKVAESSEYKAIAARMESTLAMRRTKVSNRRRTRRLASKSLKVDYEITVPTENAASALNTEVENAEFTTSFAGAFSSELEAKTKVTPSAVTPATTAATIVTSSSGTTSSSGSSSEATTPAPSKKAVADGASILTVSLGSAILVASAL